jgi:hypothetical protein
MMRVHVCVARLGELLNVGFRPYAKIINDRLKFDDFSVAKPNDHNLIFSHRRGGAAQQIERIRESDSISSNDTITLRDQLIHDGAPCWKELMQSTTAF